MWFSTGYYIFYVVTVGGTDKLQDVKINEFKLQFINFIQLVRCWELRVKTYNNIFIIDIF